MSSVIQTTHVPKRPLLVALTGVDGAGKTIQIERVAVRLRAAGYGVRVFALKQKTLANALLNTQEQVPWAAPPGSQARRLADEFALALAADFLLHYRRRIQPYRSRRTTAIALSDRYATCYKAYSYAIRAKSHLAEDLVDRLVPPPDLEILLRLPPHVAVARTRARGPHAIDETPEILSRLAKYYQRDADARPEVVVIDSSAELDAITVEILNHVITAAEHRGHSMLLHDHPPDHD